VCWGKPKISLTNRIPISGAGSKGYRRNLITGQSGGAGGLGTWHRVSPGLFCGGVGGLRGRPPPKASARLYSEKMLNLNVTKTVPSVGAAGPWELNRFYGPEQKAQKPQFQGFSMGPVIHKQVLHCFFKASNYSEFRF